MARRYDIVMVTDARLPGGTAASVAEEIRVQAAAGYRTALLQVDSPLVRQRLPFSPRLRACLERGEAQLLLGHEPVETDLVVLRHPTVAANLDPDRVPEVRATHRLMVANQAPGMPAGPKPDDDQGHRYEPTAVDHHLGSWLGGPVSWAPIGPLVRRDLAAVAPDLALEPDDWVNVIDVAAWRQPREGALHRIPVIGRHSRNDPLKWPADRAQTLTVYPARDDVEVHVLGGEIRARELFNGEVPANWVLREFGSMPPERFLAAIDVYVYYHHPELVEAFGRTILEALASGAPTVLPPHFKALFEDAAVYADPDTVLDHVRDLHGDRQRYREAAEAASSFVEERFGHGVHVERLATLARPTGASVQAPGYHPPAVQAPGYHLPDEKPAATSADSATDTGTDTAVAARRRVLFVSSNGAGVGHLMRLMSLARWAPDDIEPVFLTFSQAAKVVDDAGYLVEYLASRSISGSTAKNWHPLLRERANEIIERYDVRAVVFDGTWPYQGLLDAVADHPHVGLVWSRRPMWKPGVTNDVLETETDRFDLILEPGEFAEDEDRGATRPHRDQALRIPPITYLGVDELLDRDAARDQLGLAPDRPAVLVNLGAGNINDTSSLVGMVVERLAQEDVQVCVIQSMISDRDAVLPDNVRTMSVYPLARYLPGFDMAFAASGYNSYHELVLAGVPTAFVPNLDTATDDQGARSRFAERVGVGLDVPDPTPEAIDSAVRTLMQADKRRRMHERALARRRDNGAEAGMDGIVELLDRGPGNRITPAAFAAAVAERKAIRAAEAARSEADAGSSLAGASSAGASLADASHSVSTATPTAARSVAASAEAIAAPTSAPPRKGPRPNRVVRARTSARKTVKRLRQRTAKLAKQESVQAVLLEPYRRLPTGVRAFIRRRVRDWESPQTRAARGTQRPLPVPPGNVLADDPRRALMNVAIVLPATADDATIEQLVDYTAQLQAAYRSFAPLFVTSSIQFRPLRRHSYLFEYFPPRRRWDRAPTSEPWYEARDRRLRAILRRFDVATVITLPEPDADGLPALRAALTSALDGLTLR